MRLWFRDFGDFFRLRDQKTSGAMAPIAPPSLAPLIIHIHKGEGDLKHCPRGFFIGTNWCKFGVNKSRNFFALNCQIYGRLVGICSSKFIKYIFVPFIKKAIMVFCSVAYVIILINKIKIMFTNLPTYLALSLIIGKNLEGHEVFFNQSSCQCSWLLLLVGTTLAFSNFEYNK